MSEIAPVSLDNLRATSELLQRGVEIKPGRLMILHRLCKEEANGKNYLRFLLKVTSCELTDMPLVRRFFEEVEELIATEVNSVENTVKLTCFANELRALQPEQKRLNVHAGRRRVEYVDLYFLELIVNGLATDKWWVWGYYCYEASKLFVFNYDDMRYRVGDKTLPHWNLIVDFWQRR
jgi:hypothetical protein